MTFNFCPLSIIMLQGCTMRGFDMNFPVNVGLAQANNVGDISQSHADTDCRHWPWRPEPVGERLTVRRRWSVSHKKLEGFSLLTDRDTHTAMVEMSASVMVNASTSFIQVEEESRTELFPSEILSDLDLSSGQATFSPALTVSSPGEAVNRSNLRLFLITCYSVLRATG